MKSFNTTIDQYRIMLTNESIDRLTLPDVNFDTGTLTEAGKYLGADLAYDKLMHKLAETKFIGVTADLRENILKYYDARRPPLAVAPKPVVSGKRVSAKKAAANLLKEQAEWQKAIAELEQLRQVQTVLLTTQ